MILMGNPVELHGTSDGTHEFSGNSAGFSSGHAQVSFADPCACNTCLGTQIITKGPWPPGAAGVPLQDPLPRDTKAFWVALQGTLRPGGFPADPTRDAF